ncbi:DUF4179 domain-containing protein [Cohnella nanjingensis]|uniref:DUF4179 domain-containing protein n=1 Tax=Cohnella nanjingensis TaxID=1387779 RepID=A0A7X0RXT5_9BACL|nr:DUF4179 domain-containing protein [Cohnella nanjingensis]MBB6675657.1 DUF4179 domain-containing protein [Cohnella nanjingensis]
MHEEEAREARIDGALTDRIDLAIRAGIRDGRQAKTRARRRTARRWSIGAAAVLLIASCLVSIRVSPAFAAMLREVPGFAAFIDRVQQSNYDRSLSLAADNDYAQPVGLSDEHDGMKLTVEGILADDGRLVVYFDVRGEGAEDALRIGWPTVTDLQGKTLEAGIQSGTPGEYEKDGRKTGIYQGMVDVQMGTGVALPDEAVFKVRLGKESSVNAPRNDGGSLPPVALDTDPEFTVRFKIDHSRFEGLKQQIAMNQSITVAGQTVTFEKAEISPLRIALYMSYPEGNEMQIFNAGDIQLVDDQGNAWKWTGGTGERNRPIQYFESSYFKQPRELYVEGSWFTALDAKSRKVVIDTKEKRILKAPDDKIMLANVVNGPSYTTLTIGIMGTRTDDNRGYALFGWDGFTDGAGKLHRFSENKADTVGSWRSTNDGVTLQEAYYYLANEDYPQPLTFDVYEYPAYIVEPYRVRIR